MRFAALASRNRKELLRDPFSLVFGVGLPLVLLLLISVLQNSIAVDIFKIENFAPGIAVFSFSFISLFSGLLIASDRSSSFLLRIFASPLSATDYIVSYSLPLFPLALLQAAVCFGAAFFFGLPVTVNVLLTLLVLMPAAALFISFGLLLGSLFTDKQVGGVASIIIQVAALTSGMWFDLNMMGGVVKAIGYALPFAHAVDATRAALVGDWAAVLPHTLWTAGYAVVFFGVAVWGFRKQMTD
ncbi:MAG TPA: ABC transporter permease [Symbiobacteriaceae bacterium]|nr:ABC transporter permease [Symbiobacteriaceae bacterium]